jgi:hypothetical protein
MSTKIRISVPENKYLTSVDKKILTKLISEKHPIGTKAKSDRKIAELVDIDHEKKTGTIKISHKENDGFGNMRVIFDSTSFNWV